MSAEDPLPAGDAGIGRPPDAAEGGRTGDDVARAALTRASQLAGRYRRKRRTLSVRPGERSARDPELLGDALDHLLLSRGWKPAVADAGVIAHWREIAGDVVADHCEVVSLTERELVLQASSTAWAQNLTLMLATLQSRIDEVAGEGVVTQIKVLGPRGPSWRKGQLRVAGRGPRDTYG